MTKDTVSVALPANIRQGWKVCKLELPEWNTFYALPYGAVCLPCLQILEQTWKLQGTNAPAYLAFVSDEEIN